MRRAARLVGPQRSTARINAPEDKFPLLNATAVLAKNQLNSCLALSPIFLAGPGLAEVL